MSFFESTNTENTPYTHRPDRLAVRRTWLRIYRFSPAAWQNVTYACHSGISVLVFWVPAMPDLTIREFVLAAAIVLILTAFFIDRQVLNAVMEPIRAFW